LLPTKFLYLKHLSISITSGGSFSPSYDYVSLVSFLDASPSLETLILDVRHFSVFQVSMEHKSVFEDSSSLRQMPEHHHCYLRSVKMTGFSSAKSLVELTCHIIKNAVSLECLTLDTRHGFSCSGEDSRGIRCYSMSKSVLREAIRADAAIRMYIEDKVPTTVDCCGALHPVPCRWRIVGVISYCYVAMYNHLNLVLDEPFFVSQIVGQFSFNEPCFALCTFELLDLLNV
ncbi:hypothetical protein BAE44_0022363, partial [Dichanthelium oligosanthes]